MRLSRKIEQALIILATILCVVFFAIFIHANQKSTFADNESADTFLISEKHFVIIYDNGKKLTVKTDANTVDEVLRRADISLNSTDHIEPNLDATIDMDNFHVNIYRSHPVVLIDGAKQIYAMVASYDPRTIMEESGITVYDGDKIVSESNSNFLETGVANIYKIIRNGGRTVTIEEEIAFREQTVKDYNLAPGVSEVRQLGEIGTKKLTYNILYVDSKEVSRELVSEEVIKNPVDRIVAVGANEIERRPLTATMGRNYYTVKKSDGTIIERQETYYDLPMSLVMKYRLRDGCGDGKYYIREDGVKTDHEGYVIVAAELNHYPLCSVVETSLGQGKVYDTGSFSLSNSEQFDIAADWTKKDGI